MGKRKTNKQAPLTKEGAEKKEEKCKYMNHEQYIFQAAYSIGSSKTSVLFSLLWLFSFFILLVFSIYFNHFN